MGVPVQAVTLEVRESTGNVRLGPGAGELGGEGRAQGGLVLQLSVPLRAAQLCEWEIPDGCLLQRLPQSGLQP